MAFKDSTPTAEIVLLKRYQKTDNTYPVKLRVTYQRKQKYYSLEKDYSETEEDFAVIWLGEKATKKTAHTPDERRTLRIEWDAVKSNANRTFDSCKPFTWELFEKKFFTLKTKAGSFIDYANDHIKHLKENEQIKTASTFECMLSLLKKYDSGKIQITDITTKYIVDLTKYMTKNEYSPTTISMYLRCIRVLMNKAIHPDKIIRQDQYPFVSDKMIPKVEKIKTPIPLDSVYTIFNYKVDPDKWERPESVEYARDMWLFCYLCNGSNMKDIASLKWSNRDGDYFKFVRSKTKAKNTKEIEVFILPEMWQILNNDRYCNKEDSSGYVFKIFDNSMNAETRVKKLGLKIKLINKYMKLIASDLKIKNPATSGIARHTFATVLRDAKVPIAEIQLLMAHATPAQTGHYIGKLPSKTIKENAKLLLPKK